MINWGWKPERPMGVWRQGAVWMHPFVAAAPWLTVLLILLMFHVIGGTLTAAKGVLFELPEGVMSGEEATEIVVLMMPMRHETVVFFDDSRYLLGDAASVRVLGEHVAERVARSATGSVLVLADRRVSGGDLMQMASVLRRSGTRRILFAEKSSESAE